MDPDARVSGAGISKLEAAGIDVTAGFREEAIKANAGFLNSGQNRPTLFHSEDRDDGRWQDSH